MEAMKIVIAVFTYYPSVNGVQSVTQYQAEGLAKLGHEVTVITGMSKSTIDNEIYNGVRIIRINAYTDFMLHFGDKKKYQALLREYAKTVDVIMTVCPESWCTDWALPLAGELPCGTMMMVHGIHDFRWKNFGDRSIYGLLRKIWGDFRWHPFLGRNFKYIRQYDAIAHLHEQDFAAQYFRKHGLQDEYVLYNAVDARFFEGEKEKSRQIINVGTYSRNKNQMECLDIFYQSGLSDWRLVLIGSSKNRYYEQLIRHWKSLEKRYGHREVTICAGISRQETIDVIKRSEIYLMTSISEKFPISLLEGMASGAAWVSTDVGINRFLPGGTVCRTKLEMADALKKYAHNDSWRSAGEAGRAFAEQNCREEIQVKRLEEILKMSACRHRYLFLSNGAGDMVPEGAYGKEIDVVSVYCTRNRIAKAAAKIAASINCRFGYPFFGRWKKNLKQYDVIVCEGLNGKKNIFRYILSKKREDARLVMWHWNKIYEKEIAPDDPLARCCEQWSFDPDDCSRYHLNRNTQYICVPPSEQPPCTAEWDIYFLGADKGRMPELLKWKADFEQMGITTYFHVVKSKKSTIGDGLYRKPISYRKNCMNVQKSCAVLDLPIRGQKGLTLRVLEALCYEKKLITTNEHVRDMKFYDPENIFILGKDPMDRLQYFLHTPYRITEKSKQAREYYQFENWMRRFKTPERMEDNV